jgi:hypothetical protein
LCLRWCGLAWFNSTRLHLSLPVCCYASWTPSSCNCFIFSLLRHLVARLAKACDVTQFLGPKVERRPARSASVSSGQVTTVQWKSEKLFTFLSKSVCVCRLWVGSWEVWAS